MLYICAKFHDIISNGIKVIEWIQFLKGKLQRGIISPQNAGEATVVNLCTSLSCFIFLPSFVKLSRTVSKL